MAPMRIIAIANQKGGCGKTTTAVSLAWSLADRGRRTLMVDLDSQGHSTLALGVDPEKLDLHLGDVLMKSVFEADALRLEDVVRSIRTDLWLAPAGVELSAVESALASAPGREERLAEHFAGIETAYDVVILDCPPSLGLLTFQGLIAASEAIVPIDSSPLALQGLGRLKKTVALVHDMTGHTVRLRPLVTLYDARIRICREVQTLLIQEFGDDAIRRPVRYTVRLRERVGQGRIRSALAPGSIAAEDFSEIADQLLSEELEIARRAPDHESVPVLQSVPGGLALSFEGRDPEDVMLAGEFNDWVPDGGVELKRDEKGRWMKFVAARPGLYQYKFVLRGAWVSDPRNAREVDNTFGSRNSLVSIE